MQAGAVKVTLDGFHAKGAEDMANEVEALHIADGASEATSPSVV